MSELTLWFDHGFGDCCHVAHVLQLVKARGFEVRVHYHRNKRTIWQASDIPYFGHPGNPCGAVYHDWAYHPGFNTPDPNGPEWSGNKTALNLDKEPLPPMGSTDDVWEELCNVNLENAPEKLLEERTKDDVARFLEHLPRPIVLLHTSGTNFATSKNLDGRTTMELYEGLLNAMPGSLVLLDWDFRVPMLNHGRVRHIRRDWGNLSILELYALMREAALLIGVDSGPYHFAAFSNIPALGVFHHHYPCCVTLPRTKNASNRSADFGKGTFVTNC